MRSAFFLAVLLAACSSSPSVDPDAGVRTDAPRADAGRTRLTIGGTARPADLFLPTAHDGTTPLPLVILLHGYSVDGALQDAYFGMSRLTRMRGLYLIVPDGTVDASGENFWNATDACCDFGPTGVDDVGYLEGLMDEAIATVPVDETRIYFVGHSNGGFMSYRMACEASERIAAIAPLAGVDFRDPTACVPTAPVSVLHWHGTADDTVPYDGNAGFPSADETVARWAGHAGCDATGMTMDASFDAVADVDGAETEVTNWTGCDEGFDVTRWRMVGASHIPGLADGTVGRVLDWLLEHHR